MALSLPGPGIESLVGELKFHKLYSTPHQNKKETSNHIFSERFILKANTPGLKVTECKHKSKERGPIIFISENIGFITRNISTDKDGDFHD